MSNHHVKLFIEDGEITYIHHDTGNPSDDDPGKHTGGPTGDKVRFVSRDDGPFSIEFKLESPFDSGAGSPGSPILSLHSGNVDKTSLETLKLIRPLRKGFDYTVNLAGLTDDPEIIIDNSSGSGGPHKKAKKKKKK
jgi:hypothetical protein